MVTRISIVFNSTPQLANDKHVNVFEVTWNSSPFAQQALLHSGPSFALTN